MSTVVPADWRSAALSITCGFETTGDPYQMVAGNFDGMGISCGALQWNIGMSSLQPMVKVVGRSRVLSLMPNFGTGLWDACNTTVSKALVVVKKWQTPNNKLLSKPRAELRALMGSIEMRTEQDRKIDRKAQTAMDMATEWARSRDNTDPDKRLYCWFFDLATQNGSLEGQTPKKVGDFIKDNKPDKVDDLICDFLEEISGTSGHIKDAHKNAALWRNAMSGEQLELFCLTYLRSATANPKWRHVVINRKGAIAAGRGWVNSSKHDFSGFGI